MALTRISLTARHPQSLALFYQTALGFTRAEAAAGPAAIGGAKIAEAIRLRYGDSEIELLGFATPGRPFPPNPASNDTTFQHFAMLTPDIKAAFATLGGMAGWRSISSNGPVQLPANSGGAIAFKFRDPEGHPLEFLQPAAPSPARIDHTAIVVADTRTSVAFYQARGFTVQGSSLNQGPEQAALDALEAPVVEVTRLGDHGNKLHLELLCYRTPKSARAIAGKASNDAWAARLVFNGHGADRLDRDPDGHDIFTTQTP